MSFCEVTNGSHKPKVNLSRAMKIKAIRKYFEEFTAAPAEKL